MALEVGSKVRVKIGTNDAFKERGWIADYMTASVDEMPARSSRTLRALLVVRIGRLSLALKSQLGFQNSGWKRLSDAKHLRRHLGERSKRSQTQHRIGRQVRPTGG